MPHPPRFDLDRLAAGESIDAVSSHVATCSRCAAYVAEMTAVQAEYLKTRPAQAFLARCKERPQVGVLREVSSQIRPRFVPVFAAAVCVIVLGIVFYFNANGQSGIRGVSGANVTAPSADAVQWRGGSVAHRIFVKNETGVVELQRRSAKPGEKLRYQVALPDNKIGFAAVVAIEEGEIIPVLPPAETEFAHQIVGTDVLPGSIEIQENTIKLDLLLFVRKDPFTVSQLIEQVRDFQSGNRPIDTMDGLVNMQEVTP